MLKHLHIRNYALIREQQIDLKKGLVILTGETGSGKSILLGALNLIMGARADTKAVFNPEQKCIVEAQFDISTYALKELLDELDIDNEPELIIRREIAPGGKSRAFVNDSPVSVSAIQQICAQLVDLHQQFDTMDLVNASFQMEVLDALAGCTAEREEFGRQFASYQKMKSKLELL
jgi:DNA repair protein RecN (Recombination protein N)